LVLCAALIVLLAFACQAVAGGSVDDIITDAGNGTVDGDWSAGQVSAAIAYLKANPTESQYSDAQAVLEDYLASLGGASGGASAPGAAAGGELAFTGADTLVILGAGLALVAGGVALRRRVRA
jgi:hypothetical protein